MLEYNQTTTLTNPLRAGFLLGANMPWRDLSNWVPFMLSVGVTNQKLNMQRIAEAIIIAVITGGVTMYGAQRMVVTKLETLDKNIIKLEQRQERIFLDLYQPRVSTK